MRCQVDSRRAGFCAWRRSGQALIWLNAMAVSLCLIAVVGLLTLLVIRGLVYFWPRDVMAATVSYQGQQYKLLGEVVDSVDVSAQQLREAGVSLPADNPVFKRELIRQGNREFFNSDFVWVLPAQMSALDYPEWAVTIERKAWGRLYGELLSVSLDGEYKERVDNAEDIWLDFEEAHLKIRHLQRQLASADTVDSAPEGNAPVAMQQQVERARYRLRLIDGRIVNLPLSEVVRAYRPNQMSSLDKSHVYLDRLWEFLSSGPREGNTEGGIFPALLGTSLMVILMAVLMMPFGVLAAVYLNEYAHQGLLIRIIRIAVNNLAGVPSIIYGVFGLGFFVYGVGGELDQLFFADALPGPTFGTPGLLWASLTLALLTLPVVIVATEEGLARVPSSIREGSLALGATRAETLWQLVLPMASPAMMTGLILAIARAAGEVAPLMLVGVVKLAPALPVDGKFPFLHLDQKFMHLGYHIYDVGFQSANAEAAGPLVYATALLLVLLIVCLNLLAVMLRNHLRERYRALVS